MNILVIGNGFDLAHELPTSYQDFLRFTDRYLFDYGNIPDKLESEIGSLVSENKWIKHFKKFYEDNGWIGFEKEISDIIQIIDQKIPEFERIRERGSGSVKFNSKEQKKLEDFDSTVKQGVVFDVDYILNIKGHMIDDLNKLIRCLEIYLDYIVNKITIGISSQDIKSLKIDKVLCFNYTKTYERIYDTAKKGKIEYDFIHGVADESNTIETDNIVLGIDEYLSKKRRNKDLEFIEFKKYYQRIHKQTGCKYKDWISAIIQDNNEYMENIRQQQIDLDNDRGMGFEGSRTRGNLQQLKKNPPKHNLYIFGHSLDITDKDILKELILTDNVYTTIFYHNKKEFGRKIANLVKIIGQDELIRRTGGSTKTIEFKQQQDMIPISTNK